MDLQIREYVHCRLIITNFTAVKSYGILPRMVEDDTPRHFRSSGRMRGMEITKLFQDISVFGKENLLSPRQPVVYAASHTSDAEIPALGAVLTPTRNIGIAYISALMDDPKLKYIFGAEKFLLGNNRWYPIDFDGTEGSYKPKAFNKANYDPMVDAINHGRSIIFAAHVPTKNLVLPNQPGIGAVWLAQRSNVPVIPVGIAPLMEKTTTAGDIREMAKHPFRRPRVEVRFGRPMNLPPISTDSFIHSYPALLGQSNDVMVEIAKLLPQDRRGKWG